MAKKVKEVKEIIVEAIPEITVKETSIPEVEDVAAVGHVSKAMKRYLKNKSK